MGKKINIILFLIPVLVVVSISIYNVYVNYKDNLYKVLDNKITDAYQECMDDDKCSDNITLKDLYDNKYLDKLIDPISKEYLNEDIKIYTKEDKIIIDR